MRVHFELTDTFGGEANYSWVKRHTETMPDDTSDLAIVRRAKRWAGYNGHPAKVDKFGDMFAITPRGDCVVLFVTFDYEGE